MRDLIILAGLAGALWLGWWLSVPRGVTEPTPPPPAREVVR